MLDFGDICLDLFENVKVSRECSEVEYSMS